MSKDKIVTLPNNYERKKRVDASKGELRCEVSPRWIKFPEASLKCVHTDYLSLDIMTLSSNPNEEERKLCAIVVDRDILEKLLRELPRKNNTKNN